MMLIVILLLQDNQRREPLRRHNIVKSAGLAVDVQQSSTQKRQRDEETEAELILSTYGKKSAGHAVDASAPGAERGRAPVEIPVKPVKRPKVEQSVSVSHILGRCLSPNWPSSLRPSQMVRSPSGLITQLVRRSLPPGMASRK